MKQATNEMELTPKGDLQFHTRSIQYLKSLFLLSSPVIRTANESYRLFIPEAFGL